MSSITQDHGKSTNSKSEQDERGNKITRCFSPGALRSQAVAKGATRLVLSMMARAAETIIRKDICEKPSRYNIF